MRGGIQRAAPWMSGNIRVRGTTGNVETILMLALFNGALFNAAFLTATFLKDTVGKRYTVKEVEVEKKKQVEK